MTAKFYLFIYLCLIVWDGLLKCYVPCMIPTHSRKLEEKIVKKFLLAKNIYISLVECIVEFGPFNKNSRIIYHKISGINK